MLSCRPKIPGYLAGILLIMVFLCGSSAWAASRGITVTAQTPSGSSREIPLYSGYHALVIGCSNYTQGWPSLPNAANDAKVVGKMLKDMGWDVDLVIDPDIRKMENSFARLITGAGREPNRGILVWYSWHGYTLKEADGSKLGYIVPTNAPDPEENEYGFITSAISMRDIETVAKRVFSKHVLMMFDSCFSGAIFRMVRAKPSRYISEKVGSPVRQFITAGNEDELVPDKSVFKAVFVKGIKDGYGDRNEDGFITGEELGAYLAEEVVNYSRGAQHPQYGKINNPALDRGDFVFVKQELSEAERLKQKVASLQSQLQEQKKLVAAMDSDQGAITQTIKAEPTPYVAQPGPEAKLKAVILPWKLKGLGIVRTLRDSLEKCIPKANNIQIISSYYSKNDASVFVDIDSNYFFNYSKPDVDRISEFVSGLDGDIAIIGDVNCGSGPLDYIKFQKVYFVNVISRQVFSAKESRGITFQTFGNRASVFLCGAIEKFEQGELKTIGY